MGSVGATRILCGGYISKSVISGDVIGEINIGGYEMGSGSEMEATIVSKALGVSAGSAGQIEADFAG